MCECLGFFAVPTKTVAILLLLFEITLFTQAHTPVDKIHSGISVPTFMHSKVGSIDEKSHICIQ